MTFLRNTPIRLKLTLITMLSTGVALLLTLLAIGAYEVVSIRHSMVDEIRIMARVVGDNSAAALSFGDPASAEQTLRTLSVHDHFIAAFIYDHEGRPFARFQGRTEGPMSPPPVESNTHRFTDNWLEIFQGGFTDAYLEIFQDISAGGETIGTVYLRRALLELRERLVRYCLIGVGVMLAASLVALLMTRRLQRLVVEPVTHLAQVVHEVTVARHYSCRAVKTGDDEIGHLIDGFNEMLDQIEQRDTALQAAREQLEERVEERTRELEGIHKQLLETSRQAGMAEVATSVLHNVGNVLNSVNISATVVADNARKSQVGDLARVVALLEDHAADLGAFVTTDPQGKKLAGFLRQLSEQLGREQQSTIAELASLRDNIDHIKSVVAMQQSYGRVSGITELMQVSDLLEDGLRLNASALVRHRVQVVREYQDVPPITVEKHKVLQIVVNLMRNARFACSESGLPDRQMTLRVSRDADIVKISVSDNGVGIAPENLTRIFNHGFTTRKDGHGFGLHSGALAAIEMGGRLSVQSDGPGHGATFTLELPAETAAT